MGMADAAYFAGFRLRHQRIGTRLCLTHSRRASFELTGDDKMQLPPTPSSRPVSAVERAFEMARSGSCKNIDQIRSILSREGYEQDQIFGLQLSRQLNQALRQAKSKPRSRP